MEGGEQHNTVNRAGAVGLKGMGITGGAEQDPVGLRSMAGRGDRREGRSPPPKKK